MGRLKFSHIMMLIAGIVFGLALSWAISVRDIFDYGALVTASISYIILANIRVKHEQIK